MTGITMLLRPRLSLANGVAAAGGYLLAASAPSPGEIFAALAGVTLLAAGGSALNQVAERETDKLMERTRLRPLPAGTCSLPTAVAVAVAAIGVGSATLFAAGGMMPLLLGLAGVTWYLCVYTPLKRRSSMALLLGALSGALSPVVGWSLSGLPLTDHRIVLLAGGLYLWQIPHFWLVQLRHPEDHLRSGIRLFLPPHGQGERLYRLWIMALVMASLVPAACGTPGAFLWPLAATALGLGVVAACASPRLRSAALNLFPPVMVLAHVFRL